jgi:preprotein translocase subunit SecE
MSTLENVKSVPARTGGGDGGGGITGWWHNGRTFLTEVRNEMKRVTWPSRKEVYATTVIVILTSAFFGLYLWGIDLALDRFIRWLFARLGGVA